VLNDLRGIVDYLAIIDYSRCLKRCLGIRQRDNRICRRGLSLSVLAEGLISNRFLHKLEYQSAQEKFE